jgi:hypothetical protein
MDIAASSDTAVRLPTIEVHPKTDSDADTAAPSGNSNTETKPDFWHRAFGKDGFTFSTLLDIVNPLQHIPIVSTIYQKVTGDVASPGANIIGGALFGGMVGLAVAGADTAVKDETGKDIGGHVFAMFDSKKSDDQQTPAVADATSSADAAMTSDNQAVADASITAKASTPTTVANASNSQKAPKTFFAPLAKPTAVTAAKAPANPITPAKATTPFPFSMSASNRHAASNGIGGSFVPLETRASITPAAFTVATEPTESLTDNKTKLVQKPSDVTAPDLQTLASNPGMLLELQKNGLRKQADKPNSDNGAQVPAAVTVPLPPKIDTKAASDPAPIGDPSASNDNAGPDNNGDYAALMARNLARYMALQTKNAPAKVNQRY